MAYENRIELKNQIGKIGIFYDEKTDKRLVISRLVAVTGNGRCEDEGQVYFDNFEPKTIMELKQILIEKCK